MGSSGDTPVPCPPGEDDASARGGSVGVAARLVPIPAIVPRTSAAAAPAMVTDKPPMATPASVATFVASIARCLQRKSCC